MGPGIIARVLIVAGVCGAAYFGFVLAAPADGSVGESEGPYVVTGVAEPIPGAPGDAMVDAVARLNQPVTPSPITGGNARLRALFQGFEKKEIATGTKTRVKSPAPQGNRAGKSNNVRAKAMIRASRPTQSSSPWTRSSASRLPRSSSPWDAFKDLQRNQGWIIRQPKMYRPFEGKYLFHLTGNRSGRVPPPDSPAVQSVKSEYRRKWWQ